MRKCNEKEDYDMEKEKDDDGFETLLGSPGSGDDSEIPSILREPDGELLIAVLSMEGCPPCKTLSKALEVLREEYPEAEFLEFGSEDGEDLKEYARGSGILPYPTVLISDGKRIMRVVGGSKSVQKEVESYSTFIEYYRSGKIDFKKEEGKAVIGEDFSLPMKVIA